MAIKIEIIGLPASGKTFFYQNLKKKIKKNSTIEIKAINFKEVFLKKYVKNKSKVNLIKKLIYFLYARNIQIKSNYLFKKEYYDLNIFLKKNLKKHKNFKIIFNLYKNYINTSKYTFERKQRIFKNFEIDYLGQKFFKSEKKFNIIDEGFFQKIFFNFNGLIKFHKQINYLKLVTKPDIIVFIDTKIQTCLKRSNSRTGGFLYDNEIKNKIKKFYYNKSVINFAKQSKIPIIRLNGTNPVEKNISIFLKKIKKIE